jgi:hypothetical protein
MVSTLMSHGLGIRSAHTANKADIPGENLDLKMMKIMEKYLGKNTAPERFNSWINILRAV